MKHGLGRRIEGWLVVDLTAPVTVHRMTGDDDVMVSFFLGGACSAKVLVY